MNKHTVDEPKRVCENCHNAIKLHDKYTTYDYTVSSITIKTFKHRDCGNPESYPLFDAEVSEDGLTVDLTPRSELKATVKQIDEILLEFLKEDDDGNVNLAKAKAAINKLISQAEVRGRIEEIDAANRCTDKHLRLRLRNRIKELTASLKDSK